MKFVIKRALLSELTRVLDRSIRRGQGGWPAWRHDLAISANAGRLTLYSSSNNRACQIVADALALEGHDFRVESAGRCTVALGAFAIAVCRGRGDDLLTVGCGPAEEPRAITPENFPGRSSSGFALTIANAGDQDEFTRLDSAPGGLDSDLDAHHDPSFVIDSRELAGAILRLRAPKRDDPDPSYSNVLIRCGASGLEMVTAAGNVLARYSSPSISADRPLLAIVSYKSMLAACGGLRGGSTAKISSHAGTKTLRLEHDIVLKGKRVGVVRHYIKGDNEFVEYEPQIQGLDFITSCRINVRKLRFACHQLDAIDCNRTHIQLDPAEGRLTLSKAQPEGSAKRRLPVIAATGNPLCLNVSVEHLMLAAQRSSGCELELGFSGCHTLAVAKLSPEFAIYFQPFVDEGWQPKLISAGPSDGECNNSKDGCSIAKEPIEACSASQDRD